MEIIQSFNEDHIELKIVGELDASTAIEMDEVMKDALAKKNYKIVIDCSELQYISSAGLGVFVSYIEDIKSNKGTLVFFDMTDKVYNVFQILGLDQIIKIVGSREEARSIIE